MPSRRDENYANMQRYNSVMHRALLALLAAAGLFAQQLPFDAQALLELARIGDPQVSPDGRLVAFQVQTIDVPNNKRVTQIYVTPVAGGAARQITQAGQDNERPRWSPDSRTASRICSSLRRVIAARTLSLVWRLPTSNTWRSASASARVAKFLRMRLP